jgi:trimethyllysine dioxygenase
LIVDDKVYQIRFNNDDRSLLELDSVGDEIDFYKALKQWQLLLNDVGLQRWVKLQPGTAIMLVNWRVLHGRASFTGRRTMVGSYHNYDDYMGRVKTVLGIGQQFPI